ncbi:MAG: hypothetical protein KBD60_03230 [Sterolibacterium sp.]|jgi:hypothetical protein|nr:hypothetical protein [Sterolibacterium sp.]
MRKLQVRTIVSLVVAAAAALPMANAHATCKDNYCLALTVSGTSAALSTQTADQFLDKLSTTGLNSFNLGYNGTQAASIDANFNSLGMQLMFPNTGFTGSGAQLNFAIPGLGVTKTFSGTDRDDSKRLLSDYLKKSDIIGRIMKYQAENSPTSPITGAGGLLPTQVSTDFNQNFGDTATNIAAPANLAKVDGAGANLIGVALSYGALKTLDRDTKVTSIPLSYTVRNDLDPRRQLVISMPITQVETQGAKSYHGALGVAYRLPMNDSWTLTPSGRISAVASKDMATVAGLYSASLTSTYIWALEGFDVAMGNMISYNKTMKIKSGDYSFDPDITSTVLRNGVMLSQPVMLSGKKMSVEYSLVDTRYTGTKLYVDNTQEIGITLGTNKSAFSSRSFFRGGLTYLHGKDTKGFTLNIGYWF